MTRSIALDHSIALSSPLAETGAGTLVQPPDSQLAPKSGRARRPLRLNRGVPTSSGYSGVSSVEAWNAEHA